VSEQAVALEEILPCLQGVIPAWLATCSADGIPNVTVLSIVHFVDTERVALTRQFFNKTSANLDENPFAQVVVVDPGTADQYLLDLRFLHTETEGPTFDTVAVNLDAIASQTGMAGVFRLRGVDIHRVLECRPFGETTGATGKHASDQRTIAALDELVRRLGTCADYADATRTGLEALEDLFGFEHSILLVTDEHGDRLFAVASNGYARSSAGAEVPVGIGVIGVAAQRRRVVCVPSLMRSRAMRAGIEESVQQSGSELPAKEIALPGLDGVESVAAVPLVAHSELVGVLYLESERWGTFGPAAERLLRILGGHLAATLALHQADRREIDVPVAEDAPPPRGDAIAVAYYQADDSVFVDGEYLIKGVPGRILWKLLRDNAADRRAAFTNRELRLDESLGLPIGNDNLEARLLVLRKRLAAAGCGIGLERVGRGRLSLRLERPLELQEIQTEGPMRAAHLPPDEPA
jgi:adenylate cyclase